MDIDQEVKNLTKLCLELIDQRGIHSFRPLVCVPSAKKLTFMMDRRGLVEPSVVRAWGTQVAAPETDFLVAYHSGDDEFTIDAVVGDTVTSARFDAPDSYV